MVCGKRKQLDQLDLGYLGEGRPVVVRGASERDATAKLNSDSGGGNDVSIWFRWGDGRRAAWLRDRATRPGPVEAIARFACAARIVPYPRQNVRMP